MIDPPARLRPWRRGRPGPASPPRPCPCRGPARPPEARGQDHFHPPGQARRPAGPLQIGRGRGQRVGRVLAPDIRAAVAGLVDGEFQVAGRDELGVSHRAGPAADHPVGGGVAPLQDAQGGGQLALEELAAAAFVGQGGQRRDDGDVAAAGTEEGLQPPDRGDDLGIDPVAGLQRVQRAALGGELRAAHRQAFVRGGDVQVVLGRALEFGLVAVLLDHLGQEARAAEGVSITPRLMPRAAARSL